MAGKLGLFQKTGKGGQKGGVYYTKRGVPADVRDRLVSDQFRGKSHFVASTGEYGLGQAQLKAADLWGQWSQEIDEVRALGTGPVATLENVVAAIGKWRSRRCVLATGLFASTFIEVTDKLEGQGYPAILETRDPSEIYADFVGLGPESMGDASYFQRHPHASRSLELPAAVAMLLGKLQVALRDPDSWAGIPQFEILFDEALAVGGCKAAVPVSVRARARTAFVEAYLEVTQHEEAERRRGAWWLASLAGPRAISVDPAAPAAAPIREGDRTVGEVIDAYAKQRSGEDTDKQFGHIFRALRECLGEHKPARSVTAQDISDVRSFLRTVPAHASKLYPGLTLSEAVERAAVANKPVLAWNSVRSYMVNCSAIFNYALKVLKCIDHNPVAGLIGPRRNSVRRRAFTAEQLALIFNHLTPERLKDSAHFWVPALAVWTGARANELCQLYVQDVGVKDGTPYLDLTVFDAEGRRTVDKKVKNSASDRAVPIHPELVRAGFLKFVDSRRGAGDVRLFPELQPNSLGYFSHEVSRIFGRKLDAVGLEAAALCLHSARHGFRNAGRQAGLPSEVIDALGGWSEGGAVGPGYGDARSVDAVADNAAHMARITMGGFSFAPMAPETPASTDL